MNKLSLGLVSILLFGGVAAAQMNTGVPDINQMKAMQQQAEEAFWKKVDASTGWGAWLINVYKPYSDKMSEALMTTVMPTTQIDPTGLSPQELIKKVNEGHADYVKAIQNITPPEELKAYHARVIELYVAMSENVPSNHQEALEIEAKTNKLGDAVTQELGDVLTRQGVPQVIIAEFTKTP